MIFFGGLPSGAYQAGQKPLSKPLVTYEAGVFLSGGSFVKEGTVWYYGWECANIYSP